MTETRLPFFGVVRVSGAERAAFLHNQLSNDIEHLTEHAAYATYNTPQGRVLADMLVVPRTDDICLLMAADLTEKIVKRLRMFVLRAKVELNVDESLAVAGRLPETVGDFALPATPPLQLPLSQENGVLCVSLPHGGEILLGAAEQLPAYDAAAENRWQLHEIACGFPHIAAATGESSVAQMLNQHLLGGVHFKKGCYPGQEIIARAQYRGQVRRGLATYHAAQVLPAGAKVLAADGSDVGVVLNSARDDSGSLNLCVVKHDAARQTLTADQQALSLHRLFFSTKEDA
ncbi:MAG: folate-binding protein [Neisseria sp.]|nr:folate-binding protein [Neisseria sp.]